MSEQFEFFELTAKTKRAWDKFVLPHANGSIHQIADWADFQTTISGRSVAKGFGVKDPKTDEILATVLCVRMDTGFAGKTWWYAPRGPVFDTKNESAVTYLLKKSADFLRQTDAMFWRLDPYAALPKNPPIFRPATQHYQPTDTLELDLTQDNDTLLAQMKRKGRYNINLTHKKGVTFRTITGTEFKTMAAKKSADFLAAFWQLNHETTGRDGFSGHEKSYYHRFLTHLSEYSALFFAEYEGVPIAAAISTFCGSKAIYYFGASTSNPEYRNLMGPYGLQWHMIQHAKAQNCKTYDFLGIAPENHPNHPYAGISEFKWKFGGTRKIYPAGVETVFSPFWYTIYRLVKKLR